MLGQAQVFGDIDFVMNRKYQYTLCVAELDSQIYTIKVKDFEKVLKSNKDTW